MTETPESPPAPPIVPVGLGTKLGVLATAVLGVAALAAAVINGDHTPETIAALVGAVLTLCTTIGGRMAQAAAAMHAAGPVLNTVGGVLSTFELEGEQREP